MNRHQVHLLAQEYACVVFVVRAEYRQGILPPRNCIGGKTREIIMLLLTRENIIFLLLTREIIML